MPDGLSRIDSPRRSLLPTGRLLGLSTAGIAGMAAATVEATERDGPVAKGESELLHEGVAGFAPVREELASVLSETAVLAGMIGRHHSHSRGKGTPNRFDPDADGDVRGCLYPSETTHKMSLTL